MSIRKNVLWNLMGSATPMLIGAVTIPYIYRHLGAERVGVLTIVWALIGYFSIFDFGLGRAITQRMASLGSLRDGRKKAEAETATTGTLLTLLIGVAGGVAGFTAISLLGVAWLNITSELHDEVQAALLLACLTVPATTTTAGLRGILEGEQRFQSINLLKLLLGLSNFLGPMLAIAWAGPRLDYTVGTLVLTRYLVLIAHAVCARHHLISPRSGLNSGETKHLFQFGGWMTLSNIISPLMVVADRFLIANVLGASAVAFYTIPAEFMIRLLVLPAAITTALFPVFSKGISEGDPNIAALYRKTARSILLMMGAVTASIALGSKPGLTLWLGAEFAEKSWSVAAVLALGVLFNSLAQIPHTYIQAAGDARTTALIHLGESILYLPVLLLMMHAYGILGAAIAWTLRTLLDLVLLHFRAMNQNP